MIKYIQDKDRQLIEDFKHMSNEELETKYKRKYKTLQRNVEVLNGLPDLKPEDLLNLKGKNVIITNHHDVLIDITIERISPSGEYIFVRKRIQNHIGDALQDEDGNDIYRRSWKHFSYVYEIKEILEG